MKKIFFTIAISLFIFSACNAQSFHFGIKAGANIDKLTGEPFSNEFAYGYQVGAFAEVGLSSKWAIRPEVLFSQTNVDTANSFSTVYKFNNISDIKLNYLTIPVLLEYKVSKIVALQAGPQFGILMQQNSNLLQNGQDAFKQGDFSLAGGIQVKLLGFSVYGRYVAGLTNMNNTTNQGSWKNQTIQIGVGYAIL